MPTPVKEFRNRLETDHGISLNELQTPTILPDIRHRYTVKDCKKTFNSIDVIISPFSDYQNQLHIKAARATELEKRNSLNEEYIEKQRREESIIQEHIDKGMFVTREESDKLNEIVQELKDSVGEIKKQQKEINKQQMEFNQKFSDGLETVRKELMAPRNIYRLGIYISVLKQRIVEHIGKQKCQTFYDWSAMSSFLKDSGDITSIDDSVREFGLSKESWNCLQHLSVDLDEWKHGLLKMEDGESLIKQIAGTSYNYYVESFQELVNLVEQCGWTT